MTDQWWKIDLAPDQPIAPIQQQFYAIFAANGAPRGGAMFCDRLGHRRTALFFTPEAGKIAEAVLKAHGGAACAKPREGILVVGNAGNRMMPPPLNL